MPRYQRNDEIIDAIRYQPRHAGRIIHRLSEFGIPCLHLRPSTEAIEIFDHSESIAIQDPRHSFGGAEGVIYPGDWIVLRALLAIEIVPSAIFDTHFTAVD